MTNNENKELFKSILKMAISNSCKDLTSKEHKISYNEGKNITNQVRNVFIGYVGFTPKEIDGACDVALIFIAPTMKKSNTEPPFYAVCVFIFYVLAIPSRKLQLIISYYTIFFKSVAVN